MVFWSKHRKCRPLHAYTQVLINSAGVFRQDTWFNGLEKSHLLWLDAVKQKYMLYDLEDPSSKHVAEVPDLDLYWICKDLEQGEKRIGFHPQKSTQLSSKNNA